MKVLIGTPIHEVKDYAIPQWLDNVKKLQEQTPCDFLMVDNTSGGLGYVEKIKEYCAKITLTNYQIEHLEIGATHNADERIGRSREIIREKVLNEGYDAWFSWECDQLVPLDTLDKLIDMIKEKDYDLVSHNSWGRGGSRQDDTNTDFGVTIIQRRPLEKHSFLLANEIQTPRDCWHGGEAWFRQRLLRDGGRYIQVYGIIDPIYHLDDGNY